MSQVLPVFRAAGTASTGTTGATAVAAAAGVVQGDLEILVASTIAGGTITITTAGGSAWTALGNIDVTAGEKLYVWWRIRQSGDSQPSVTPGSDHVMAAHLVYQRGTFDPVTPIANFTTSTEVTSDTSFSFAPGFSTTLDNSKVACVCTSGVDSNTAQVPVMANTSLTSLASRANYNTLNGGGGGFGYTDGTLATAGAVGTFTATLAGATPKAYAAFTIRSRTSPSAAVIDSFTRANENPAASGWVNSSPPMQVLSNQFAGTDAATGGGATFGGAGHLDGTLAFEVYATIATLNSGFDLSVKQGTDPAAAEAGHLGYTVEASGSAGYALYRLTGPGTSTSILTGANTWASGDGVGLSRDADGLLIVWQRSAGVWLVVGTVYDTTYTGHFYPNLGLWNTTSRWDDLAAGPMVPDPTPVSATAGFAVESLKGIAATQAVPEETVGSVASTAASPAETLQPAASTAAVPLEANRSAAATATGPLEVPQGITAAAGAPGESIQPLTATAGQPVESVKPVVATSIETIESAQQATATTAVSVEAGKGIAATVPAPLESVTPASQVGAVPAESAGATGQLVAVPTEAVGVAAGVIAVLAEAAAGVSAVTAAPAEAPAGVSVGATVPAESAKGIAAIAQLPFDAAGVAAAAASLPVDELAPIASTAIAALEALGAVAAAGSLPVESQSATSSPVSQTAVIAVESLGTAAASSPSPAESVQPAAATTNISVESLRGVTAISSLAGEALAAAAAAAQTQAESLRPIAAVAVAAAEAARAVAVVVVQPVEAGQGVVVTVVLPVEAIRAIPPEGRPMIVLVDDFAVVRAYLRTDQLAELAAAGDTRATVTVGEKIAAAVRVAARVRADIRP